MPEKTVVIGAGVFGAWTAHHLLRAGHTVTLVDAFGPAHSRSSSGDESRLIRASYGKDEIYARMARDSLPAWKELSADAGLPLFAPTGILAFFRQEEAFFTDTVAAHRALGIATEVVDRAAMTSRWPMFHFEEIEVGLFEPEFGALMARRSVQTLVHHFVRAGGDHRQGEVVVPDGETLTELALSTGERLAADRFVFAAGAWLPKLFPDVIGQRIRPTRQEVFYFAPPAGDPCFQGMPSWIDFHAGDMFYGMPDLEGRGVKFAHDIHGPPTDPDTQDRLPTASVLADVVAYRDRRFAALRGAPLTEARVCQYENSCTGDFLIDLHPRWANALIVGAGSGHGFKHGPEVGRYAAQRLFGENAAEPRFSLSSKTADHARAVH